MPGETSDPGPLGYKPAGQASNGDTQQQEGNRFKQKALKYRPGCGEPIHLAQLCMWLILQQWKSFAEFFMILDGSG
jgi:hypothetical protein